MALRADELEKDYYRVLDVPETATDKEITRAYRRLARQLHPDAGGGSGDSERFGEVAAAYEVLHDPAKRREYDEARRLLGASGLGGTRGGSGRPRGRTVRVHRHGRATGRATGPIDVDLGDLFGRPTAGGAGTRPRPRRGPDLTTEVHLDFEEAVRGTTREIRVVDEVACAVCGGIGLPPSTFSSPCLACGGQGVQHATRTVTARVPTGVEDGQTIRVEGRGGPGRDGGPAGDLRVRVHVAPHRLFGRQGRDLTVTLQVTFAEAALGADVRVPTLDQPVTLRIPPGTQTGTTFRIRGRGVPARAGPGDLLVTVHVEVPRHLTDDQRAAVEALAAATPGSSRSRLGG
ncbi:MAG TPA: DnaJ C-terminal domain-containing protein [Geodermatophilus sp.]|nr:DnaJ C-terminal domain-containing protein [Geodermatophilus sp.]